MQTLVTGKLIKDAETKVSQKGTNYLVLMLKNSDEQFVRVNLFGDDALALANTKRGDAVSVVGSLTVGIWEKSANEIVPSISVMAHRAISAAERKPYKPKQEQPNGEYQRPFQKFVDVASQLPKTVDALGDDLPWQQ